MKRPISLLLTALLALGLCGCSELKNIELPPLPTVTPEATEPAAEPSVEPTEAPKAEDAPQVIVSVKRSTQEAYDPQDGSRLILTFSYDTPAVYIEGGDEAAAAINERIAMMDEAYYTGNDYGDGAGTGYNNMLTMAEDNFNYVVNSGIEDAVLELTSTRTVSVERMDSGLLTLLYNDYAFTGGIHGSYGSYGCNFDVSDGKLLSLEDLSGDYEALSAFLLDHMVNAVENDLALAERIDLGLFEEGASYADILAPLLRQGSWYFDDNGLVIFSGVEEISNYADGPIFFNIPYDELKGHVDDKWLPAGIEGSGSLEVISGGSMVDGSLPIVDKLVVDSDGGELYLSAEGSIRNVEISRGDYLESPYSTGKVFYVTGNLWYCSAMDGSALQLVCSIPEGMPSLRLSYDDGEGRHVLYLSHSDEGSAVLTETVEAVG